MGWWGGVEGRSSFSRFGNGFCRLVWWGGGGGRACVYVFACVPSPLISQFAWPVALPRVSWGGIGLPNLDAMCDYAPRRER